MICIINEYLQYEVNWSTLHSPTIEVSPTEDISGLIAKLKAVKHALNGVGLAAPQIGVLKRIAIAQGEVLINPVITRHGRDVITDLEGCLSTEGHVVRVPRWRIIDAVWYNEQWERQSGTLYNLAARVFQHELDHLDGKLIADLLP